MNTKRVLICGSRDASPFMLDIAHYAVQRAKVKRLIVTVGDASGVDAQVVQSCIDLDVPFVCFGITPVPRIKDLVIENYIQVHPYGQRSWIYGYLQRDKVMVNCSDTVFGIWNGVSRGTKYTCDYAEKLGKEVYIRRVDV